MRVPVNVLPLAFTGALAAFMLLPRVQQDPRQFWAFAAAAAALLLAHAVLYATSRARARELSIEVVLRKQHYIQACAQGSVLVYWGWHWRQVYDHAYLIVAQLLFAYAFDMLLAWSRRDRYTLGFGPFPVIFSINLFLWFRDEWVIFQFLMVAVGFAAKELITWEKNGRRAHIFNPSSFPLAVAAVLLLVTGASDMTWGKQIATTQFYPPNMYVALFVIGLPGQFFFGVTSMTMSAVVTTYLAGLAYYAATGVYFFYDSYIPIAVFLGMHLLFTDPSTSPRTELGRIIFGAAYGLSTMLLYVLLGRAGLPTFYDKLLQVPLLNLSIKGIDWIAESNALRRLSPARLGASLAPRMRHLAYISVWFVAFSAMTLANGVSDRHPGQWLPFWQQACDAGRPWACEYLTQRESELCDQGSEWACDAYEGRHTSPALADYPLVLRGSKGPLTGWPAEALYEEACRQGWPGACERMTVSRAR